MSYLENLFSGTEQKREEVKPEKKVPDKILVDIEYLKLLREAFGGDTAIEIAEKYKMSELIKADKMLDQFQFPSTPDKGKARLEQIVKVADFAKNNEDLAHISDYWSIPGSSVDEFLEIIGILHKHFGDRIHFMTIRDHVLDLSMEIAEKYGTKFDGTNHAESFKVMVHHQPYVLPNVSANEFMETIFSDWNKVTSTSYLNLKSGFDDWKAALEAMKVGRDKVDAYLRLGFTSKEKIQSIDAENAKMVLETFGKTAIDYVRGSIDRFKEVRELADKPKAYEYVKAFGGSFRNFKQMLGMKTKASAAAIEYVRDNFGLTEMGPVLKTATSIDTECTEIFNAKTSSIEEFLALKARYEEIRAQLNQGKKEPGRLSFEKFQFLDKYPGDIRFFRDFDHYEAGKAEKISACMGFDTYNSLRIKGGKPEVVLTLIGLGYSLEDMKTLSGNVDGWPFCQFVRGLDSRELPLPVVETLAESGVKPEAARGYMDEGLFGAGGFQHSMIPVFVKHKMQPEDLKTFTSLVSINKYYLDKGFDIFSFLRDYRLMHNLDQGKKEGEP